MRHQVLDRAWQVYQAATERQFSERLRRVGQWTPLHLSGPVATMGVEDVSPSDEFTPAYDCPQAHRTSMRSIGCSTIKTDLLYAMALWHGTTEQRALGRTAMGAAMELSPLWVHACGGTSHRGCPFTISTALVSPRTGCLGLLLRPLWEADELDHKFHSSIRYFLTPLGLTVTGGGKVLAVTREALNNW